MSESEKDVYKNKIAITIFVLIVICAMLAYIMLKSSPNDEIRFRYCYNNNTGERLSVLMSIFIYFFVWIVFGMLPGGIVAVFTMYFYWFLHRKDKNLLNSGYHPKYESELYYGMTLSMISGYAAVFVLVLLHAANIATIVVL